MQLVKRLSYQIIKSNRKLIVPEPFTAEAIEEGFYLINSKSYSFVLKRRPQCDQIYEHCADTPSNLLKKNAIHIFPDSMGQVSGQEKYAAHLRRLREQYKKAFDRCEAPAQMFHLDRRVKTDIRRKCELIGRISGRFKHYHMFESLDEINGNKTQEQYCKNGVQVKVLNNKPIYPRGAVWMPTNQEYLGLFDNFLNSNHDLRPTAILELGCGSGVLSFMLSKAFKSSTIWAVDSNEAAVETCQVNGSALGFNNINAFQMDFTKSAHNENSLRENKAPVLYDLIVCNPPWLAAKRMERESKLLDGVYDDKGKCLQSAFELAGKMLRNEKSRFVLIYSDLSSLLGLQSKSVEQLAQENSLLVHSCSHIPYSQNLGNESPLNSFKLKAKVFLYEIGKA